MPQQLQELLKQFSSKLEGFKSQLGSLSSEQKSSLFKGLSGLSKGLKTFEPSVLTDLDIRDKVIPDLESRAKNLYGEDRFKNPDWATGGKFAHLAGGADYGKPPTDSEVTGEQSVYDEYLKSIEGNIGETDPLESGYNELYESLFKLKEKELEETAKKEIDRIKGLYDRRKRDLGILEERAGAEKATLGGALFASGASRYGGVNMGITSTETALKNNYEDLLSDEQEAINDIKDAQAEGNYRIMEARLEHAENIREQKRQARKSYIEEVKKQNEKIEEETRNTEIHASILDLMSEGKTDPIEIMTTLGLQGIEVTPDEVKKYTALVNNQDALAGLQTDFRTYEFLLQNRPEELEAMGVKTYEEYIQAIEKARAVGSGLYAQRTRATGGRDDDEEGFDAPWGGRVSNDTLDIIDGIANFDDLTPTKKSEVRSELRGAGYYSDEVPEWFQDFKEKEWAEFDPHIKSGLIKTVGDLWNKHRNEVIGGETEEDEVSEDDIKALIKKFPKFEDEIREAAEEGYSIEEIREQIS